jgi:hypothetical protein
MRAAIDTDLLEVAPGAIAAVGVEVANNGTVIDGVTAKVIGLDEQYVETQPPLLPLFPDARGQLTLLLEVPTSYPAGRHPLAIEVESRGARVPSEFLDLTLDVASRPRLRMGAHPKLVRTRRSARFVIELTNSGNVPLEVHPRAVDVDRSCETQFSQRTVRIEAGATAAVVMNVRCPRMLTGGEVDRNITVLAEATRLDLPPDEIDAEAGEDDVASPVTGLQVRQRPIISRGLLTALILASIVALWASVVLLGLNKVFSSEPMTKEAPASFFVAGKGAQLAANFKPSVNHAPAGALQKKGQVPVGIGAEITGTVYARSDHQPVGGILVEAIRLKGGKPIGVSSAATQTDGTYTLAGLFPTSYYIQFGAKPAYNPIYWPGTTSRAAARMVPTSAQKTRSNINVVITGNPATISGKVTGADGVAVPMKVTAHPTLGNSPPVTATADAAGDYVLKKVQAPGTYQLTFTSHGYLATVLTDTVSAGDTLHEPDVRLGANVGQIRGTVSDGGASLGGATVSTTINGKPVSVTTPTSGLVGTFEFDNVPTPGTYVIRFSAPGHGAQTKIIGLRPGEEQRAVRATLTRGAGSVTGKVFDQSKKSLGGVTIKVGGATTRSGVAPTTTTLTDGAIGTFAINNLKAPGAYTLTATRNGYEPATVPFQLKNNGKPAVVKIRLGKVVGTVTGVVTGTKCTQQCVGVTVSATNGARVWTTTATINGGPNNRVGYRITGLQPGTYSVTATTPGAQQTAMVTITAGQVAQQPLVLDG